MDVKNRKLYIYDTLTVAYTGFLKGVGGRKFRKIENSEDQNEKFSAQNQVRFSCPKLGEDQKKQVFTKI